MERKIEHKRGKRKAALGLGECLCFVRENEKNWDDPVFDG